MEPARVRGYTALALMLVTWVVQSEIVQSIEEKANRPFLITFLNHASMALLVPFLPSGAFAALVATAGASKRRVAAVAAALSIVYTAGDYLWYVALPYTSVAEATVLFQAQSVFAVFLAAVLLRERPTVARVLGIAVSLGGVSLVACDGSSAAGGRRFLGTCSSSAARRPTRPTRSASRAGSATRPGPSSTPRRRSSASRRSRRRGPSSSSWTPRASSPTPRPCRATSGPGSR
ncbi:GTPase [Aureococcus anophagefferens]|nr:GTPase [Aureococcus anophagefferens]